MPGLAVGFHPDAVAEAQAARQWYLERSPSAADAFLTELDHGLEAISQAPERWPMFEKNKGGGNVFQIEPPFRGVPDV